ncbi:hypothetical protein [Mucilaginibacter sp.]|uniref:hypothetical protein n=1 Tax=Mucilaginibacter sp. TaxID=1882438 RepID=UPI002627086F|nr:hypothetical protein [Mucilaginibacter sp.]
MKKLIIAILLCGLIFTAGTKSASAQIQLKEVAISGTSSKTVITKKVSDSFEELFKGAVAPEWIEANKNFIVNFILDNQKNKAEFTRGGRLLYLIVYGKEKEMPADLRTIVKSTYFDYGINSTIKINFEGRTFWIVNLEDANHFVVLRVEDGDMDVIKKIKKI